LIEAKVDTFVADTIGDMAGLCAGPLEPGEECGDDLPVSAGGTVTTDTESDGATAEDPVETSVTSPSAGTISILEEEAATPPPAAFQVVGQQVQITAPPATAAARGSAE
jgi:hypothetical protein